jgi:nucleotide-binding universal stress UspA family protein
MYKRVLVATDGSEPSQRTVRSAIDLARRLQASLFAVRVTMSPAHIAIGTLRLTQLTDSVRQRIIDAAENDLEWVRREAANTDIDCLALRVVSDHPWRGIIDTAADRQCDLIVMARHGHHGWPDMLLGSETQNT